QSVGANGGGSDLRTSLRDCKLSCCGEARISIADGVNFFLAGMQSGFGPFVAVLLANEKWTQQNIGLVLKCQQSSRLVEPTARRRAARRQPVQAISGRTRRNHRRGQRARHRTLAKPSGGLCCL